MNGGGNAMRTHDGNGKSAWEIDLLGLTIDLVVASTFLFFLSKMTDDSRDQRPGRTKAV